MTELEIKYQTCKLCEALLRNINDNFKSVSFEILDNGDIQTKIILTELGVDEEDYIDDLMCEFTAVQSTDCVLMPIVEVGDGQPLENLVYFVN